MLSSCQKFLVVSGKSHGLIQHNPRKLQWIIFMYLDIVEKKKTMFCLKAEKNSSLLPLDISPSVNLNKSYYSKATTCFPALICLK